MMCPSSITIRFHCVSYSQFSRLPSFAYAATHESYVVSTTPKPSMEGRRLGLWSMAIS